MTPERLGQHFLDVRWRERIAHAIFGLGAATPAAQPHKSSGLWIEIGAGHGEMTSILAQHRANIVETDYDRAYHGVGLGETAIEITMETRGPDHIAEIISALGAAGYTQERVL